MVQDVGGARIENTSESPSISVSDRANSPLANIFCVARYPLRNHPERTTPGDRTTFPDNVYHLSDTAGASLIPTTFRLTLIGPTDTVPSLTL